MDRDTALALVTLAELPGVGERRLQRIAARALAGGVAVSEVLALPAAVLARDYHLPATALMRLTRARLWHGAHCRGIVARLDACGGRLCTPGDRDYPAQWRARLEPPPLLYAYGEGALLAPPVVALLSSRLVTEQVVTATMRVVRRAAADGCSIAVGGMKATHRIAAMAVRASRARRLVVLDRGLFAAFRRGLELDPFGPAPGLSRFDPHTTLVLSTFRPHDHAVARNGRRRDELIAALGDVVVAASARPGGEVERICLRALDRGQCVLIWQAENEALLAAGAQPLDESELQRGLRRFALRAGSPETGDGG
jgi:predicted Rossmann fold nucleotide-binding protein DprA/Smf involved in DNA uptake